MRQLAERVENPLPAPAAFAVRSATAVIADHHPLVLEGLTQVLSGCSIDVVQRCGSGAELLDSLIQHRPSLVLMDGRIGDPDGLTVMREVRRRELLVPVIFVTGPLEDHELLETVKLGIRGLVAKAAPLATVAECVRTVLSGGTYLDQALVARAVAALLTREAALRELARLLTVRELQILQMIVAGRRPREMADTLCLSDGTVKVHVHHIYEKMKVSSRQELITCARARGLV